MTLALLLLIVALVLFGVAAFNVPSRVNLIAGGLFFATLSVLVPMIGT